MNYFGFNRLRKDWLANPIPTSTTSFSNHTLQLTTIRYLFNVTLYFFPVFEEQYLWDNCNFSTIATACTQDVEYIFSNAYVPPTTNAIELFGGNIYICTQFLLKYY